MSCRFWIKVVIVFFFTAMTLNSQQMTHGAFAAPVLKNTSLLGQYSALTGARVGWIINETYVIGGAFYALANHVKPNYTDPDNPGSYSLDFNCGGLEFEVVYPSEKYLHGSFILFLGGGGGKFRHENPKGVSPYGFSLLVWEPQLNLEMNLLEWLHLNAGVSYRFINGFDNYYGLTPDDLKGISGVVSLKFGSY
ncbi:MAG: hypothetical protein ACM34K_10020 [Bacillota bacterium]